MLVETIPRMALLALLAIVAGRILRLLVRIVTSAAPQSVPGGLCAATRRELLDVADHLKLRNARRAARLFVEVNRKYFLEFHSRLKVPECSFGIQDASFSAEVTLLAYAVSGAGGELRGAEDRVGGRPGEVRLYGSVAAVTRDGFGLEHGIFVLV